MLKPEIFIEKDVNVVKLRENITGHEAPKATEVKLWLEGGAVKFLFECTDNVIISRGKKFNDKLYEGDVVEFFLTLGSREKYLELEVNPDGAEYAVIVVNEGGMGNFKLYPFDSSPFTSLTERTPNGWRSEWSIPLENLTAIGWTKDCSFCNIYRQDYSGDGTLALYAFNPTYSETFHLPASFVPFGVEED